MNSFIVSVHTLRAARSHAPDKDIRYYLLGVHFDLEAGRIVSTDGHRLLICKGPVVTGAGTFIMPNSLIDSVIKALGKRPLYPDVTVSIASGTIEVKTTNGIFSAPAVQGIFPDWRRVVPRAPNGNPGQYNPQYLAEAREAFASYLNAKPEKTAFHVAYNGDSAAVCTTNDDTILIVVMPMRDMDAADAANRATWAVSLAAIEAAAAA